MPSIVQNGRRYLLGVYRGIVTDNNDPDQLGRVLVKIPSIWGDAVHTSWVEPSFPSTEFFIVPPVGAQVWIMFDEGDPDSPIYIGSFLKTEEPHSEAKSVAPKARSIKTEESLRITLDDDVREIVIQVNDLTNIVLRKDDNKIIIDAEAVEIGEGASHPIVLGDTFMASYNSHVHSNPEGGFTGTPVPPMSSAELSSKHKVE